MMGGAGAADRPEPWKNVGGGLNGGGSAPGTSGRATPGARRCVSSSAGGGCGKYDAGRSTMSGAGGGACERDSAGGGESARGGDGSDATDEDGAGERNT